MCTLIALAPQQCMGQLFLSNRWKAHQTCSILVFKPGMYWEASLSAHTESAMIRTVINRPKYISTAWEAPCAVKSLRLTTARLELNKNTSSVIDNRHFNRCNQECLDSQSNGDTDCAARTRKQPCKIWLSQSTKHGARVGTFIDINSDFEALGVAGSHTPWQLPLPTRLHYIVTVSLFRDLALNLLQAPLSLPSNTGTSLRLDSQLTEPVAQPLVHSEVSAILTDSIFSEKFVLT